MQALWRANHFYDACIEEMSLMSCILIFINSNRYKMNLLSNMDEIADLIIRPSRYSYKPIDLGPKIITL